MAAFLFRFTRGLGMGISLLGFTVGGVAGCTDPTSLDSLTVELRIPLLGFAMGGGVC